jgi:hypothetical protein
MINDTMASIFTYAFHSKTAITAITDMAHIIVRGWAPAVLQDTESERKEEEAQKNLERSPTDKMGNIDLLQEILIP